MKRELCSECDGCIEARKQREAAARAELRSLMFFLVDRPINWQTTLARRDLVRREAPRFRPEKAFARYVGDPIR